MLLKQNEWPGPILLALAAMVVASASQREAGFSVRRFAAESVQIEEESSEQATLVLPVALVVHNGEVFIADSQDCAVKIFSKTGKFIRAVGRKGKGPGELWFPSGVSCRQGLLYIADKLNYRIQILERDGKHVGGFGLPFAPDKVLALAPDRILVTHNSMGHHGAEATLHVFSRLGALQWEGLSAGMSGDKVFDMFANAILVNPGGRDDFYVIHKCEERSVLHFGLQGRTLARIPIDERYAFKTMSLPTPGQRQVLRGFCWDSDFCQGRFYLLAPDETGEHDLGPGRTISVFSGAGRLESLIELPVRVAKFAVAGDRIYAVDDTNSLRIFRVAG